MAPKTLEDILKELGWDSGFRVPVSNEENRLLEEEVARLTLQKLNVVSKHTALEGRVEALKNHYKFINQEIDQTQKLITTHKQQLDSENNRYVDTRQEKKNCENDIKNTLKKIEEAEKKVEVQKSQIERNLMKMEKLKAETDWDEAALNAWDDALKKRDEDNELIKKFSEEDERKYNELESRRQILQVEHMARSEAIAKMVCDIQNYELVMERTGKMIKQQVIERNSFINQWKDTIKILQQRDADIAKSQEKLITIQEVIDKQNEALLEQQKFLEHEKSNNRALMLELQDLSAQFSKLKKDYLNSQLEIQRMGPEVHALKTSVAVTSKQLENERVKNKQLDQFIADKDMKIIKLSNDLRILTQKAEEMLQNQSGSAERVANLDKLYLIEQEQEELIFQECEKLQDQLYRNQMKLKVEEDSIISVRNEIKSLKNMISQNKKRILLLQKHLDKNIETAYDFDFRIGLLEKELYETEETHYDDDYEEKEGRIIELDAELTQLNETSNFLQDQITKIHDEMRRLSTAMALDKKELEKLKEKLEYQMIFCDIGQKQLSTVQQSVQEKHVEENIIRLQVANIEKNVKKEDNSILTLQRIRLALDQAVKERQVEINATKTILSAKLRSIDEEKRQLKAEIAQRNNKLDILQKRYHVFLMSLGKDEEGNPVSVAHIKVKVAQEKFFLRQEGDDLDTKIQTAEKEIVAMENTLKLVNVSNDNFKVSLAAVKPDGEEMLALKAIEDDIINAGFKLKESKAILSRKKKQFKEIREIFDDALKKKQLEKEILIQIEQEFRSIRRQEQDKQEKLERAELHLNKLRKSLSNVNTERFDRDFVIRRMKDANNTVLYELAKLNVKFQVLSPKIVYYISEYGLQLPRPDKSPSVSSNGSFTLYTSSSATSSTTSTLATYGKPKSDSSESASLNKVTLSLNF